MPIWYRRSPFEYVPPDPRLDMPSSGRISEAAHRAIHPTARSVYGEVQVGRYLRYLQKFLGMKSREPAEVTLAAEIMPTLSLFAGVENRYLESWERFGFGIEVVAGAGLAAAVRITNPALSNVLGVIEALEFASSSNDKVTISVITPPQATGGTLLATDDKALIQNLDGRGRQFSVLNPSHTTGAGGVVAGVTISVVQIVGSGASFQYIQNENQEIPLTPNSFIHVTTTTSAATLRIGWRWRERFLEDSERA